MSGTRRMLLLIAGTAIGVAIAASGDLSQVRHAASDTAEALAAAPHDPAERQLARDISRLIDRRKELEGRIGTIVFLQDLGNPLPAMDRALEWAHQHGSEINELLFEEGVLQVRVVTDDPRVAIALARDLVGQRLIVLPEIKWTSPRAGAGPPWLVVSARLARRRR